VADTDQSLYNLRYNQVTRGMEGFGGGSPMWTPLLLEADGGVSSLNSLSGALNLVAGSNITITPSGSNITIASSGESGVASITVTGGSPETGAITLNPGTNITIVDSPAGTFTINATGGGGGTPAGSNTQIQYNNSGAFGASDAFEWIDTAHSSANTLNLNNSNGTTIAWNSNDAGTMWSSIYSDGTGNIVITSAIGGTTWTLKADGGLLLPQLTTEPSSPTEGELIYNITTHHMEYWNSSTWVIL
jgi:hypothetical protein